MTHSDKMHMNKYIVPVCMVLICFRGTEAEEAIVCQERKLDSDLTHVSDLFKRCTTHKADLLKITNPYYAR